VSRRELAARIVAALPVAKVTLANQVVEDVLQRHGACTVCGPAIRLVRALDLTDCVEVVEEEVALRFAIAHCCGFGS
jgi:predicted signal transduction protein with EAL and GGDEF domain